MHPYKNLFEKVKFLLKTDDNLTKKQAETQQWQLLIKIDKYTFSVGKGGVNTMFFSASNTKREVLYPEDLVAILKSLTDSKTFVYLARDKKKATLGYSYSLDIAKEINGAYSISSIDFKGKRKTVAKKHLGLSGGTVWQKLTKK